MVFDLIFALHYHILYNPNNIIQMRFTSIPKNEMYLYIDASFIIYMSNNELGRITDELMMIRALLERIAKDILKRDLETVATTKERRSIWRYMDGSTSTDEIAQKTAVSQRTVQIFVKELLDADLVTTERRGYPRRKFDFTPSSWRIDENGR